MVVEWTYWVYATIQSLLVFTCVASCILFSIWSMETWRGPRPELWTILPLSVWTHAAIGALAIRWVIPRATDMDFTVKMLQAVSETQSYTSYMLTSGALLAAVGLKVAKVWAVRRWSRTALAALFATMLAVSLMASWFHHGQIESFCEGEPLACRVH